MDKIFDESVEVYLLAAGVSKNQIAKIKFDKLKEGVLERLKEVVKIIERDEYEKIKKLITESPAGDGYGCDNYYINFGHIIGKDDMDIEQITTLLATLKENSTGG